jgi:hypothetical protein
VAAEPKHHWRRDINASMAPATPIIRRHRFTGGSTLKATEFAIHAWLAKLTRQTGRRLTWEHRSGVHMVRCDGTPIGTMTSLAAVETFLSGYERALEWRGSAGLDITPGELDQAA